MMLRNDKPLVLHLPLYVNSEDKRIYRNFYGKGKKEVGFTSVNEIVPFDDIRLCYYDADLIEEINTEWLNHVIYPRETEFAKIKKEKGMETERMTKFEPYIFLGFEFLDTERRNGNFEMLNAVFSDRIGTKYFVPINGAQVDENKYGHLLTNFTNAFYSDTELQAHCKQNRNSELVDSVQDYYVGSDIFIDKSKLDRRESEHAYNLGYLGETLKGWGDGYFHIKEVRMLPSYSNKPFFNYFAIASNGSDEFAIPIEKDFSSLVVNASVHRKELADEAARKEREQQEREAEWARQDRKNRPL